MPSITDLIKTYSQLSPTTADTERVAEEAAQQVLDDLPKHVVEEVATPTTVPEDGLDVSGKHVAAVWAGAERASRISLQEAQDTDAARAARLLRRGKAVWWIDGTTLKGEMPPNRDASFVAYVVDEPTATALDSTPWTERWRRLIAAIAARRLIDEEMGRVRSGVVTLTDVTIPSPPSAPTAPSISYTDASDVAPTATSISSLPTAPTFSKPSDGSKPTAITVGTLDLSTEIDGTTALTPPTVGDATAPTYGGPTSLSLDFSDFATYFDEEDPEMGGSALEKLRTEVQEFRAQVEEALGQFQSEIQAFAEEQNVDNLELQRFQQQVERQVRQFADEVQAKIQKYSAEGNVEATFQRLGIEAEQARVQAELQEYQAEVQKRIEQAQIAAQEAAQTAQQATETDVQNKAQQLQADVQDYQLELERFQSQVQRYQAEVETALRQIETSTTRRQQTLRMLNFERERLQERALSARRALLHGSRAPSPIDPLTSL